MLRQIDVLDGQIAALKRAIAEHVLASAEIRLCRVGVGRDNGRDARRRRALDCVVLAAAGVGQHDRRAGLYANRLELLQCGADRRLKVGVVQRIGADLGDEDDLPIADDGLPGRVVLRGSTSRRRLLVALALRGPRLIVSPDGHIETSCTPALLTPLGQLIAKLAKALARARAVPLAA